MHGERGEVDNHTVRTVEPLKISSILEDFAANTSAHGVSQVILHPRIAVKLVWSLLVSAACIVFCIQTSNLLSHYYTFRTNVELVNSQFVEFPAVTICNFNRMKRSKLAENSRYKPVLELEDKNFVRSVVGDVENYDWLWPSDYWSELSAESMNQSSPETVNGKRVRRDTPTDKNEMSFEDYSYGVDWDNFLDLFNKLGSDFASKLLEEIAPSKEELRTMGHQAKDFVMQCYFNQAKCDYRNFTAFQNKQYGNCFTFNLTQQGRSRGRITKVGSDYGLHLTLFIEKLQYVGLFTEESGVRLVIHPQNVMPHPEDVGISVSPGFATSIGLRQVLLKRLDGRYGNCTNDGTKNHLSSDKYDYSIISCQKKCLLDHMKEKCGCVNNIYDDYANIPNCKDRGLSESKVRCQRQVENDFHTNKLNCNCPAPCREYVYNTKLSTALWPSEFYQPHLRDKLQAENISAYRNLDNTETSRQNLVRIKIYFEELNYELIEQVPAHTVSEVLGSIGGLLGLYIGFSVLTICEIVALSYQLTSFAVRKLLNSG